MNISKDIFKPKRLFKPMIKSPPKPAPFRHKRRDRDLQHKFLMRRRLNGFNTGPAGQESKMDLSDANWVEMKEVESRRPKFKAELRKKSALRIKEKAKRRTK